MDWYLRHYLGLPLDLPSLIAGRLGWDPATLHEKRTPPDWLGAVPHSHRAEDDALGYAHLLLTVLAMPVAAEPAQPAGGPGRP